MAPVPPGPLAPGTPFADHVVGPVAGSGANGTVYRALHLPSGTHRALKIGPVLAPPDESQPLFELVHPDIIRVHAAGVLEGRPWQSMEWVAGHDLSRYTAQARLLPPPIALAVVSRLARALAHAHRAGITHRDIKPANVRVHLAAGVVKLGDFGTARLPDASATRTGLLQGTPAYMAPEVLAGDSATAASDLYALGAILYELLSSHRPHEADSLGALLQAIASQPPRPLGHWMPDAPASLERLLADLLHARPQRRMADGETLAAALDAIRQTLPGARH